MKNNYQCSTNRLEEPTQKMDIRITEINLKHTLHIHRLSVDAYTGLDKSIKLWIYQNIFIVSALVVVKFIKFMLETRSNAPRRLAVC